MALRGYRKRLEFQQKLAVTAGWFGGMLSQVGAEHFPTLAECLGEDEKEETAKSGPMDPAEARANMMAWITVMNAGKKTGK